MKPLTDEQVQQMLRDTLGSPARGHVELLVANRETLLGINTELRAVLEAVRPKIAVAVQVSNKLLPGYASLTNLLARIDAVLKNGKG